MRANYAVAATDIRKALLDAEASERDRSCGESMRLAFIFVPQCFGELRPKKNFRIYADVPRIPARFHARIAIS